MVEIEDEGDLERWLEPRPTTIAVAIASRAALRVLPLIGEILDKDQENRRRNIVLPTFRMMLAAELSMFNHSTDARFDDAARRSVNSAQSAAELAVSVDPRKTPRGPFADLLIVSAIEAVRTLVDYAARPAHHKSAVGGIAQATFIFPMWDQIREDVNEIANEVDIPTWDTDQAPSLAKRCLWLGPLPSEINRRWTELRDHLLDTEEGWEVWVDWYDGILAGAPRNPDLELAKILIPDKDWKQGPAHVNGIIADLTRQHLARSFPKQEIITVDPVKGEVVFAPSETSDPDRYDRVCLKLEDSVSRFAPSQLSNFYVDISDPVGVLSDALSNWRDRPILVFDRVALVTLVVDRCMESDALLADDFKVTMLMDDLRAALRDIPDAVPAVAEELRKRAPLAMQGLEPEARDRVQKAALRLADAGDDAVRAAAREGADALDRIEPGAAITDEADRARIYTLGWMLFQLPDLDKQVRRLTEGSDSALKIGGAIFMASQLYPLLLRLFQ